MAVKRLREEDLKKLLEESSKLLNVKTEILAIDSTGLREDNASFYYAKRSGKKRKSWRKLTIVVDTDSQMSLSATIVGVTKRLQYLDRLEVVVATNLRIE